MPKKKNSLVASLSSLANLGSQAYEEKGDPDQFKSIETSASRSLQELADRSETRLIILTGDAGHGKTHLCRKLVESSLGLNARDALRLLNDHGNGLKSLGSLKGRPLFVAKDLSEIESDEEAGKYLIGALERQDGITVVCANEGKLREACTTAPEALAIVRTTLDEGVVAGRVSIDPGVHVLNLNAQSVTSGDAGGFVGQLLQQWVVDQRSWRACKDCSSKMACPVFANKSNLGGDIDPQLGEVRRSGIVELFRTIEHCGNNITIRELLIVLAYAITAGLDCKAVHALAEKRSNSDPMLSFTQLFFEVPERNSELSERVSLLSALKRVDPGQRALRPADDAIIADESTASGEEGSPLPSTPKTRAASMKAEHLHRSQFRRARRRAYFDESSTSQSGPNAPVRRAERLGFRFHHVFDTILSSKVNKDDHRNARSLVLRGLEAVQDVRRGGASTAKFVLIDPAFAKAGGRACLVSRQINARDIQLLSSSQAWRIQGGTDLLCDRVDWTDREVVVAFPWASSSNRLGMSPLLLRLDLISFEFVCRAAEGLACRSFFRSDIRRITNALAPLAQDSSEGAQDITVVFEDKFRNISIEDNTLTCEMIG